jgi:hypothetical protein
MKLVPSTANRLEGIKLHWSNIKSKTFFGSGSKEHFDLLDSVPLFFDGIEGGMSRRGG